ncbi:MAG: hypothetical protein K0Q55_2575 [Verrucomicrobia bacterium]|jgi:hypothetical protein|nr:hypothetical protein [Verrucomicrobiota bacterium]
MALKLAQSQIWKLGNSYLRIVKLERLSVDYKDMPAPKSQIGTHHTLTKKEFCRLIKDAELINDVGASVIDSSQQMPLPVPAKTPIPVSGRRFRNTPGAGKPRPPRDQSPRKRS